FLLQSYKRLALIAHSMGGLAAQQALVDDDKFAKRVSHVVLFGTPSLGLSKASRFAFWKRQVRDLAEGSRFIVDLRAAWKEKFDRTTRPAPFKFLAVAGDQDEFVPRSSSIDLFPKDHHAVVPGNHTEIVKPRKPEDLSVQVVVQHLLGNAAPSGP